MYNISSLFFSLFGISRDPRIRTAVWNRGYEDTIRDRQDRKISRVSGRFFFRCRNKRLQSSSMDMSICPRAICNSMQPPRAETHPRSLTRRTPIRRHKRSGCRFRDTSFYLLVFRLVCALGYYSHSSAICKKLLINNFSSLFLRNKNLILHGYCYQSRLCYIYTELPRIKML